MGGRSSNHSSANTSLCSFPFPAFSRTVSCFTWRSPYRGDRSTHEDVSFCSQPAMGLALMRVWMANVVKLNWWVREGRQRNVPGVNRAPGHEGVSSLVRNKLLALEQIVEDEARVWEPLGHSGLALKVGGGGLRYIRQQIGSFCQL